MGGAEWHLQGGDGSPADGANSSTSRGEKATLAPGGELEGELLGTQGHRTSHEVASVVNLVELAFRAIDRRGKHALPDLQRRRPREKWGRGLGCEGLTAGRQAHGIQVKSRPGRSPPCPSS